ncbi:MAG: hypothetical protein CME67_05580 [Halobacteriovoraceae bacterium]|nr:hypothetical protein [Halobacteriovoraceae bacterium]
MDEIYFLVRYTPFWAVPLLLIGGEFAYLFWLRRKQKLTMLCLSFAAFGLCALVYYYWAGGPEKSVKYFMEFVRFYST